MSTQLSQTTVIIAIPGSQETKEWQVEDARAALSRGEIEPTQWAWSAKDNDWKTVAELPEFQTPVAVAPVAAVPVKTQAVNVTRPIQAAAVTPARKLVTSRGREVVEEESGFSFFKLFIVLLGLGIIGLLVGNYILVDQPLRMNLTQTTFPTVPVHAHLGAFCQRDTLVIHLLPTKDVSSDKLADFLASLAKSTPPVPMDTKAFASIGLTTAWTSEYMMSGGDWESLGKMVGASSDEKKDFILQHMVHPNGDPLLLPTKITDPDALAKRRDQTWTNFSTALFPS